MKSFFISLAALVLFVPTLSFAETACTPLTKHLAIGMVDASTDGQVTVLQKFLARHFNLVENDIAIGYFGTKTERYLLAFQKESGIPANGLVGPITRAKINALCTTTPVANPSTTTPVSTTPSAPTTPSATTYDIHKMIKVIYVADGATTEEYVYGNGGKSLAEGKDVCFSYAENLFRSKIAPGEGIELKCIWNEKEEAFHGVWPIGGTTLHRALHLYNDERLWVTRPFGGANLQDARKLCFIDAHFYFGLRSRYGDTRQIRCLWGTQEIYNGAFPIPSNVTASAFTAFFERLSTAYAEFQTAQAARNAERQAQRAEARVERTEARAERQAERAEAKVERIEAREERAEARAEKQEERIEARQERKDARDLATTTPLTTASSTPITATSTSPTATSTPPIPTATSTATTTVSTKFKLGDFVRTLVGLNVRETPSSSGILLGIQTASSTGRIVKEAVQSDGFIWWGVDYTSGADGWSVENYLERVLSIVIPPASTSTPTSQKFAVGDMVITIQNTASYTTPSLFASIFQYVSKDNLFTILAPAQQVEGVTWWKVTTGA